MKWDNKIHNKLCGRGIPGDGRGMPCSGGGMPCSGGGMPCSGGGMPISGGGMPISGGGMPCGGGRMLARWLANPVYCGGIPGGGIPGGGIPGGGIPDWAIVVSWLCIRGKRLCPNTVVCGAVVDTCATLVTP